LQALHWPHEKFGADAKPASTSHLINMIFAHFSAFLGVFRRF
jgi:hypothetical protein